MAIAKTYQNESITKSAADTRKYRGLELNNGMKILLISDPDTDKSSASMDVHIGKLDLEFSLDSKQCIKIPEETLEKR